ncbi:uncharacterized protein LOC113238067, partial [Hyposmocoma kahamanoa]|uniref:uncharacterized protein LOC113238067 n=1 Tax=Hyposmocoma kahamanoa TaxID=1477025 RepID=UPI000E6D7047
MELGRPRLSHIKRAMGKDHHGVDPTKRKTKQCKTTDSHRDNKTGKIINAIAFNMFIHIFFIIRSYLDMFLDFVFSIVWNPARQPIPPLDARHKMLAESAVSLAEKIRKKELKSVTLVQVCIERIKAVNTILNAVTDERFEDALKDATEVDKLIEGGLSEDYFKQKPFL